MKSINNTIWDLESHTVAKHKILERYLQAWMPILSKGHSGLNYIDGFAGPGIYSKGEEGSPLIALRTAVEHKMQLANVTFLFVERRKDRAETLKKVLKERFPTLPSNFKYEVVCGEFADVMGKIIKDLEAEGKTLAPTFVFVDPFGLKGFPMSLLARILNCPRCEVLITFMEGFAVRFTGEPRYAKVYDELFDTSEWRKVNEKRTPEERKNFLLELYQRQLKKIPNCYVRSFEMKDSGDRTIYYLVYATKHQKGMEVMKEAMWNVDSTGRYSFSDRTDPRQKCLLDYTNVWWTKTAGSDVYNQFRGKTVPLEDVRKFVILDTPWLFRRKGILSGLEKQEKIVDVRPRKRKFTYPDGCKITFSESEWKKQIKDKDGTIILMVEAPFGRTNIKVRFPCRKCGAMVESSEEITLEEPNYSADTISDSVVWSENEFGICRKCGEEHVIEVQNSIGGMLIAINGVKTENIEYMVTRRLEELEEQE